MEYQLFAENASPLPGLALFEKAFPDRITADGTPVFFHRGRERPGFSIVREKEGYQVRYSRPCDAYRALGLLLADDPPENLSQDCAFGSLGVMLDMSRNAAFRPESLEAVFRKLALLGYNSVQLYLEDMYQLSGEPFFGYARGAYSHEELRRIDEYASVLGIEVIACIQTLGHHEQILQWPVYQDVLDTGNVLLVGEERTRQLIGKMLDVAAECFRSRTIHIGMDEAHGVGTGNYLVKHGYERRFDILCRHLQMVAGMCRERGLEPMMWSDMFFRLGSVNNDYYDQAAVIPEDVAPQIPANVDLVYWDYYHADPAFYEEWIRRHRLLGKEPIYAAGGWATGRFWSYAPRWREAISAGMRAARAQKLSKVLLTIWFDNGGECHPDSVLPAMQYFAEWAYVGEPDDRALERQFMPISPGSPLPDYLMACELDEIPAIRGALESESNFSKWILWHDPVLGFLNAHLTPDMPEHYRNLAARLNRPDADEPIRFAARVARSVAAKSELHLKTRAAWKAGDLGEMRRLRFEVLPECLQAVRDQWKAHRAMWREWNKPFGWEVLEGRYARCVARLESLGVLLDECLENPSLRVPEWDYEPLVVQDRPEKCYFHYANLPTPSALK